MSSQIIPTPVDKAQKALAKRSASAMIHVTRINHTPLVLNSDLIEHIETTPDTVVSLTNGQKFMVLESADEIIRKVIVFRRQIAVRGPALLT